MSLCLIEGIGRMPMLIDNLAPEKRAIAEKIIANLRGLEAQAAGYGAELEVFKEKLAATSSRDDFFALVQQIIAKGREVNAVLLSATEGMDQELSKALDEYISKESTLTATMGALHFNASLTDSIVATKERLSEHTLLSGLPESEKTIVETCIKSIKELKVFADLLESQKTVFRDRLSHASSIDEIDSIDEEITAQDSVIQSIYRAMVSFPKDEATAGAMIDYLETNQHILGIMQSFDFAESLADDTMGARARMARGLSHRGK